MLGLIRDRGTMYSKYTAHIRSNRSNCLTFKKKIYSCIPHLVHSAFEWTAAEPVPTACTAAGL